MERTLLFVDFVFDLDSYSKILSFRPEPGAPATAKWRSLLSARATVIERRLSSVECIMK